MRSLDRKLLRDLWRLRGQVLAIALIMSSGVSVLVMGLATVDSLSETARAYYERYRFAQIFAHVIRAPEHIAERIQALPGVHIVETRIVRAAVLDMPGFDEPVIGQLVSVPEHHEPLLNALALREGRYPRLRAPDEVVVSEAFARAHSLHVGNVVRATLNGKWRELRVVGVALSPEFVYSIGPGALMPDDRRFGVLWLGRAALAAAFDLDGAFDDVSIMLLRGASAQQVIDQLDVLLEPYGGTGAYERADQLSNWFLMNEIAQLHTLSRILPSVFLAVAAFLTYMVLARLIAVERSEIGLLKAFGYRNREVAWHYLKFVLAIGLIGVALGCLGGYWFGAYMTRMYTEFYHFPFLLFRPGPGSFALGAAISLLAAVAAALAAVRRAVLLAPAAAMRPPAPPLFRRLALGSGAAAAALRRLDQPTRILLRQIGRWPIRSLMTSTGIAMSVAVLVISLQWLDAIEHIVDVYFKQAQSQDITVGFNEARATTALRDLEHLPGVLSVEPLRVVPAKLRSGRREQREALQGVPARQQLHRVFDASGHSVELPVDGLVISTMLAQMLQVQPGDTVAAEILEGRRQTLHLPVAATFETYIGSPAYIEFGALSRHLRQRAVMSGAHLRVDPRRRAALFQALKAVPYISAVTVKQAAIDMFHATMARTITIFISIFALFACTLAVGVTYNAARIALSERGRELATLRVLGFTRAEISYILLGEIAVLTLVALPLGCLAGYWLASLIVRGFQTELYRVPFVIESSTYAWAIVVGVLATAAAATLVRRRLDRLDLIAVLKTRE